MVSILIFLFGTIDYQRICDIMKHSELRRGRLAIRTPDSGEILMQIILHQ